MRSDHVRAGLPVLAEAHRAAVPGVFLLMVWTGDGAESPRPVGSGAWADAAGGLGRASALRDLLADPGHLPRHHGPAARAGPLLHQPRRRGRAATTLVVLGLVGDVLPVPTLYGVLGRVYTPELVASRATPTRWCWCCPARLLGAAPASCSARWSRPARSPRSCPRPRACSPRWPACCPGPDGPLARGIAASGSPPLVGGHRCRIVLALLVRDSTCRTVVGLAFAVAASSFCPLLVLGIWWRGLTDVGAAAGLVVGGAAAARGAAHVRGHRGPAGSPPCSASRPRGRCRWRSP